MAGTSSRYDKEAARLAQLPRAERFEELLQFPLSFTFKAIGKGKGFWQEVRAALDARGHDQVILVERASSQGKFYSLTFDIVVSSGSELDQLYDDLQRLPSLVYLL